MISKIKEMLKKNDDNNHVKTDGNQEVEFNSDSIISLSPNYEIENLEEYENKILSCLNEKRVTKKTTDKELSERKNRNIAVTGDFSSGKSSILCSFFAKHREYKTITVSMGLFDKEGKNTRELYEYILKQILYTVNPIILPFSRYNRKDKKNNWFYIYDFVISSFIVLSVSFFTNLLEFNNIFSIISYIVLFFIFVYCLFFNVCFKKISLEVPFLKGEAENRDDNILNGNIEELIHFFKSTKYRIIIFEDLDRRDNYLSIINNLCLINYTINNSIKRDTIQFIYTVNDRCFFDGEERTKHFDSIIPIKSFLNSSNSKKALLDYLNKNGINNIKNINICLENGSEYLTNSRMIFDFVNEYTSYYDPNMTPGGKEELFYVILYKIAFPSRYYLFTKRMNVFSLLFSSKFELYLKNNKLTLANLPIEDIIIHLNKFGLSYFNKFDNFDSNSASDSKNSDDINDNPIESTNEYENDINSNSINQSVSYNNNKEKLLKTSKNDLLELNDFEKNLIRLDVITKNYSRLFVYKNDDLNGNTYYYDEIVEKIRNDENIRADKIDDINSLFKNLRAKDFIGDSILNVQIIDFIIKNKKEEYIQIFMKNITVEKLCFIIKYENKFKLLKSNVDMFPIFWSIVSNNSNNIFYDKYFREFVFYSLKYCDLDYLQSDNNFVSYLKSHNGYLSVLSQNYYEVREKFVNIDFKFNSDLVFYDAYNLLIEDLIDKFELDKNTLKYIFHCYGLKYNDKEIFKKIVSMSDNKLKSLIINEFNQIFTKYFSSFKSFVVTDDDLVWIINETKIDFETFKELFSKMDNKVVNLALFSNILEYYTLIVNNNKYKLTIDNIESILFVNSNLLESCKTYIQKEGFDLFDKYNENKEVLDYLINSILNDMDEYDLIKWLDCFKSKKLDSDLRRLIINNASLINLYNYDSIMHYDSQLLYLLHGGKKILAIYVSVIERLYELGILTRKYTESDGYIKLCVKKVYQD